MLQRRQNCVIISLVFQNRSIFGGQLKLKESGEKLIVCGLNGAGKSTFGRALSKALGYKFADIEDYYFSPDDITYSHPKSKEEVSKLLCGDITSNENFILSAIKGDYGDDVSNAFTLAIYLYVPKEIRLNRVKERSAKRFGDRILQGGDLYLKEGGFFHTVEMRTGSIVSDWLIKYDIPIMILDGTKTVSENIESFLNEYESFGSSNVFTSLKSAISRITLMENYFDTLLQDFSRDPFSLKRDLWKSDMLRVLTAYYEDGRWLYDYKLDEAGLLPKNMKRGVLSEDALYDFFSDADKIFY